MTETDSISRVAKLEGGTRSYESGWNYTNEDTVALISGLAAIPIKGGGYLGIGGYHNLDIAIDRQADAVVVMDMDSEIVRLNQDVLQLIEQTESFEDMLPTLRAYIQRHDLMPMQVFEKYITTGTHLRNRIPLSWAKDPEDYSALRQLVQAGRVAVAHADITKPFTLRAIGDFFGSNKTTLQYANLTNVENPGYPLYKRERKALGRVPESLYQAGGTPSTLVISNVSVDRAIPEHFRVRVLQPTVEPVPQTQSMITFQHRFLLRTLEDFAQQGPIIEEREQ